MGTNSLMSFYYSDDNERKNPIAVLYRNNDSFPEEYLRDIGKILYIEDQKEMGTGRLNWDMLVTKLINNIGEWSERIYLVGVNALNNYRFVDYKYELIADAELYSDKNLKLSQTIKVKINNKEYILYDYLKEKGLNKINIEKEY